MLLSRSIGGFGTKIISTSAKHFLSDVVTFGAFGLERIIPSLFHPSTRPPHPPLICGPLLPNVIVGDVVTTTDIQYTYIEKEEFGRHPCYSCCWNLASSPNEKRQLCSGCV